MGEPHEFMVIAGSVNDLSHIILKFQCLIYMSFQLVWILVRLIKLYFFVCKVFIHVFRLSSQSLENISLINNICNLICYINFFVDIEIFNITWFV